MGGALLRGWIDRGIPVADIVVIEPAAAGLPAGVARVPAETQVPATFRPDVVVLAVKPQILDAVLPPLARFAGATFLSIAAGKPLAALAAGLGADAALVRAMPNTPAAVGRGVTVAVANARVDDDARRRCSRLLEAVGEVAWIEDESLMDAVTAVSGSGPAYVFMLAETLAAAGVAAGLPADLSERLARATVAGAGEMLHTSPLPAERLRRNVTSPNGTTAAALEILMAGDGMAQLLERAVAAATRRSRELAG